MKLLNKIFKTSSIAASTISILVAYSSSALAGSCSIINRQHGQAVDFQRNDLNAPVITYYDKDGANTQSWNFVSRSQKGRYVIQSNYNDLVLDYSCADVNCPVLIYNRHNGSSQLWDLYDGKGKGFLMKGVNSQKYLTSISSDANAGVVLKSSPNAYSYWDIICK